MDKAFEGLPRDFYVTFQEMEKPSRTWPQGLPQVVSLNERLTHFLISFRGGIFRYLGVGFAPSEIVERILTDYLPAEIYRELSLESGLGYDLDNIASPSQILEANLDEWTLTKVYQLLSGASAYLSEWSNISKGLNNLYLVPRMLI